MKNTEIPPLLEKYHFSIDRIVNEKNFPLLEQSIPRLCADRIDYALREFHYWLNPAIVNSCLQNLTNWKGEIAFLEEKIAFEVTVHFLKLQTQHWGGYEAMMRYYLFSYALKKAIEKNILTKEDFYRDEQYVLSKMKNIPDVQIGAILRLLKRKKLPEMQGKIGKKIKKNSVLLTR